MSPGTQVHANKVKPGTPTAKPVAKKPNQTETLNEAFSPHVQVADKHADNKTALVTIGVALILAYIRVK